MLGYLGLSEVLYLKGALDDCVDALQAPPPLWVWVCVGVGVCVCVCV